jgi:solute carrier family 25 citrate transporter 1
MGAQNGTSSTPAIVSVISGGIAGGVRRTPYLSLAFQYLHLLSPPRTQTPSLIADIPSTQVESGITYPLEYTKTRVQLSAAPPPHNPFAPLAQAWRQDGFRALYRGCGVQVVGSVGKDAVRFLGFDSVKNALKDAETGTLSPLRNMLAGMCAGVLASLMVVTPTERVKTALIDDARGVSRYNSTMHAVRLILREDGFVGLYRGFAGTTLKQASSTSFRMGSYNIIKDFEEVRHIPQNTAVNFINGSVAGMSLLTCGAQISGTYDGWMLIEDLQVPSPPWQASHSIPSRPDHSRQGSQRPCKP